MMHLSKRITASIAKQLEGWARADARSKRQVDDGVKKKEGRVGNELLVHPSPMRYSFAHRSFAGAPY